MSAHLALYKLASRALTPLTPLYLQSRLRKGKEIQDRLSERFGKTDAPRPDGALVWLHAASVGESLMLLPLIERILSQRADIHIIVTTGTLTSAQIMAQKLPERAVHQFAPIDTPSSVTRFLEHWKPDMAIWAESEIWPNLILQAKARGIPMALVNARMSAKTRARWQRKTRKMGAALFNAFNAILPADNQTAQALSDITGRDIPMTGNLKYAAKKLSVDIKALASHRAVIAGRPVWCAASTHEGEDEIILAAHKEIIKTNPQTLLILVPRHPERGPKTARLISASGLEFSQSTYAEDITDMTNVVLIAAMGQLGLAYRLSSCALIGGSMLPQLSGHNPLEPARLDCAVLSGPHRASFDDIYSQLETEGAVQTVANEQEISGAVLELLGDDTICRVRAEAAQGFARSQDGVLETVWAQLSPFMPKKGP